MSKKDLLIGFIIGFITTSLSTFLFLEFFTIHGFVDGVNVSILKTNGYIGKVITISTILNLIAFFIFLQKDQDIKARGVILATVTLTLVTIFI